MQNMMMGSLDGKNDRVAFDVNLLERIIHRENTKVVRLTENSGAQVEVEKRKYSLVGSPDHNGIKPYFLLLSCGCAFNVNDYRLLFGVKRLPNDLISGVDASGEEVLCSRWDPGEDAGRSTYDNHAANPINVLGRWKTFCRRRMREKRFAAGRGRALKIRCPH